MVELLKSIPDIIKAAAASNLGILALIIIVVGALGYFFFKEAPNRVKALMFLAILGGVTAFAYAALNVQREDAERALIKWRAEQEKEQFVRNLRFKLIFDHDRRNPPANPRKAKVSAFVQTKEDSAPKLNADWMQQNDVGGITLIFKKLNSGDKLFIVVKEGDRTWQSDDLIIPQAQLRMGPAE